MDVREGAGGALRRARQARGIARSDAAAALGIPERFLADLEGGRLDAFGPSIHATAYLRVYARYLGLDEERVVGEADTAPSADPPVPPRQRRALVVGAASLIAIGALVAIVTVLLFDPDGDALLLDGLSEEGSQGAAPAEDDDTAVRSRALRPSPRATTLADDGRGGAGARPRVSGGPADALDDRVVGGQSPGAGEAAEDQGPAAGTPDAAASAVGVGVAVQLLDGAGDATRLRAAREALEGLGYDIVFVDLAAATYERTTVLRGDDAVAAATALLAADPRFTTVADDPGLGAPADLHVIVGLDWPLE